MLVSSMKFTCCLHNIRMPRSDKCRTSNGMAVNVIICIYRVHTLIRIATLFLSVQPRAACKRKQRNVYIVRRSV